MPIDVFVSANSVIIQMIGTKDLTIERPSGILISEWKDFWLSRQPSTLHTGETLEEKTARLKRIYVD